MPTRLAAMTAAMPLRAVLLLCLLFAAICSAQNIAISPADPLKPEQIVVIYNLSEHGSRELAEEYAAKRGVPAENLFAIGVPFSTEIRRETYIRAIAGPVRDFVNQRIAAGTRVRCLLSVFGVPLRVSGSAVTSADRARSRELDELLDRATAELDADIRLFEAVGDPKAALPTERPATQPTQHASDEDFGKWLIRYQQAIQSVERRMPGIDIMERPKVEQLCFQALSRCEGLRRMVLLARPRDPGNVNAQQQITQMQQKLNEYRLKIEALNRESPMAASRTELYQLRRELEGIIGLIQQAYFDQLNLSGKEQIASLEGELATILWPGTAPLYRWLPNPLQIGFPPPLPGDVVPTTLMAMRLDAPTLALARKMLDDSIATEKKGLWGTFYIDARGLVKKDGYLLYDDDLRALAAFLKEHSPMPVVLDNNPELFAVATCPDAALYCGWYGLEHYVDAFTWVTGAVGYHIASLEAVDLRDGRQRWVQQLIRHGVAATVGAVAEPYLHSFPVPSRFFPLLMTGQLTYAECYYATTPMLSWMQSAFGDPLYKPFAIRPALEWRVLADSAPPIAKLPLPVGSQPASRP